MTLANHVSPADNNPPNDCAPLLIQADNRVALYLSEECYERVIKQFVNHYCLRTQKHRRGFNLRSS
jgi:hypothetical protein